MAEYINREAIYPLAKTIIDALNVNGGKKYITLADDLLDWIDDLPAADVRENICAENIYMKAKPHCEFKCSACQKEIGVVEGRDGDGAKFDYCPFCSAMLNKE